MAAMGALSVRAMLLNPGGNLLDPVTMAHPHRDLAGRQTLEKRTTCIDQELGMAILALGRLGHPTAELMGHQLHTIADAENRGLYLKELSADRRGFGYTLAGPPERIMPRGSRRRSVGSGRLYG